MDIRTAPGKAGAALAGILICVMLCSAWPVRAEMGQGPSPGGLSEVWGNKSRGSESPDDPDDGSAGTSSEAPDSSEEPPEYNTAQQLTEDDLVQMNGGNITILYSEEGFLTFLRGRYWDEKVTDPEDGIRSLFGMAALLGLGAGSEFFAVYGQTNRFGYTTYVYRQRYGDLTLENAVLKIFVDPEGYTCGLVSSFTPNIGFAPENERAVTEEEAVEAVKRAWEGREFHFYEEYTRQTSVTINDIAYHAWAVFTDSPQEMPETEMPYLEHLVAYDGSYLIYTAVSSPEELVLGDNALFEYALSWFDGKKADVWTGIVTLHDGTPAELTVPVVQDEEGLWYLADADRHILVTDYHAFAYGHDYEPWTSADNSGWPDYYLITYANLIRVYDFFAEYGYTSVDGCGMPILLLTDYCTADGRPVDNACFSGLTAGWARFCFSDINTYGESIDVVAHEYTHGITFCGRVGDIYANESGALNEASSDIIGNLCEMLLGATEDETWLLGEVCGTVVRSMSFPWLYRQPVKIGGSFYMEPSDSPSMANDFGGVHTNSSLINYIAWQLYAQGMAPEDELTLWLEALNYLTPKSGFREIHYALEAACEVRQADPEWIGRIHMLFEQAGIP